MQFLCCLPLDGAGVAETPVADYGIPGNVLQRQCAAARTIQKAWKAEEKKEENTKEKPEKKVENQAQQKQAEKARGKNAEVKPEKGTDAKKTEEEEFTFLEQHLEICLEGMRESLASMRVPREQKEKVLDDLSASGMAAIQSSMKSSQGRLMLYRHFRRLHVSLRSRMANMMPSLRASETATPTQSPSQSVARSSLLPLPFGLQGFQPKGLWK